MTYRLNSLKAVVLLAILAWATGCASTPAVVRDSTGHPPLVQLPDLLQIHFLDVGQGDSVVIISPNGRVVLIDSGPPEAAEELVAELQQLGIWRINLAVITHAHADHIGGFQDILDAFEVLRFGDPGYPHPSEMYTSLLERILGAQIPVFQLRRGQWIRLDDEIEALVLSPSDQLFSGTRSDANANSVVLLLTYRDVTVLFMGDAEEETETQVARDGLLPPVDVLKVSHHGGGHSSVAAFLAVARPDMAVISCGEGNSYGHPSPETLERLQPYATSGIYRTDLDGTVSVRTDGHNITVSTEHAFPQATLSPAGSATEAAR